MRHARTIIPVLPTAMTLGNLVCGFMAMAKTVDAMAMSTRSGALDPAFGDLILHAVGFVFLGMIFDALDGRVARMSGTASSFGAQVDSLADVVTFGVTPALMAKVVYEHAKHGLDQPFMPKVVSALCALYVIGATLRLARFTVSTDEAEESHETFTGLPSPAAAGVIASAVLFVFNGRADLPWNTGTGDAVGTAIVRCLPWTAALLGLLMVSHVPYVHVAQRYLGRRAGVGRFVNVVVLVSLVLVFYSWSLFLVSLAYVSGGLIIAWRARLTRRTVLETLPDPWDDVPPPDQVGPPADWRSRSEGERRP